MRNLSASLSGQHRPSEGVFFLGIDPIRSGSIETARILALQCQALKRYGPLRPG